MPTRIHLVSSCRCSTSQIRAIRSCSPGSPSTAPDSAAACWLLEATAATVHGLLRARVGGDQPAAEALSQETLLAVSGSAAGFRGDAAVATWMCAIARRRLARHYERERKDEIA